MMVIMALIGMTGIGAAATEETHTVSLFAIGLRFGSEQARIDLGLIDHEIKELGAWSNHQLFQEGYDRGYTKTMSIN